MDISADFKNNSNILTKEIIILFQYPFIAISLHFNIARENCSSDEGLTIN